LQECDSCPKELEEIRQFARGVHNATAPFRESTQKISARQSVRHLSFSLSKWAAVAAVFLFIGAFWYIRFAGPDVEQMASWGIEHYSLVDQTHPVKGDASVVQAWFESHHQLSVRPPSEVDYSRLTGCKVTEMNSKPVALMRLEEQPVRAVFILPEKSILPFSPRVLQKDGYQIEFWKEDTTVYMSLIRI
jgi:hypothetical protein